MLLVLFNLSGATTLGLSGTGEQWQLRGTLHSPKAPALTGTSPSDCLVSYPGHLLGEGSYPSAEKQSVYSTAPANRAIGMI